MLHSATKLAGLRPHGSYPSTLPSFLTSSLRPSRQASQKRLKYDKSSKLDANDYKPYGNNYEPDPFLDNIQLIATLSRAGQPPRPMQPIPIQQFDSPVLRVPIPTVGPPYKKRMRLLLVLLVFSLTLGYVSAAVGSKGFDHLNVYLNQLRDESELYR